VNLWIERKQQALFLPSEDYLTSFLLLKTQK